MPQPPYRTIYLVCPANVRTGGPEAIHQLGRALRDLGHDAQVVYVPLEPVPTVNGDLLSFPEVADPTPVEYKHYDLPHTFTIWDHPANAVVFPEVWPEITRIVSKAALYMWWLSIDNGLGALNAFGGLDVLRMTRCIHLCQSYYALSYLAERGIAGIPLFDYTSPEHVAAAAAHQIPREDRVLYPAKGRWFTSRLKRWAPDLLWQEISGFTPAEVQNLFLTSKLYVDFGKHPGKDRMPREAAVLGCCVIIGSSGAAGNAFDIPIPQHYKVRDSRLSIPIIAHKIRMVLRRFEACIGDFETYRRVIRGEQAEFVAQTTRIFDGKGPPAGGT